MGHIVAIGHYTWLALIFVLLTLLPYALMTLESVLLWKRSRILATALMVLGFAAILTGDLVGFLSSVWLIVGAEHVLGLVIYYVTSLGQLAAGIGLL
jgi:hypothetical protein